MKVAVVGPGALGCLFAARFHRAQVDTTLVDYRPDRAARLAESGLRVTENDQEYAARPRVTTTLPSRPDLVLVLTKSHATRSLPLTGRPTTLTLQNGLGNAEAVATRVGSAKTLAGSTSEACTLVDEGCVRHIARGETVFGAWTTCPTQPVRELFTHAGFNVSVTESPGQTIWEKAAISAAINPLTALLNVPNGRLLDIDSARQLLRDLVVEAAKVAAMEGYRFPYSLVERAEAICARTAENLSSMLQDVRAGKPTEIDAISGEILRRAEAASLPLPRTRTIYQLVQGLEQR